MRTVFLCPPPEEVREPYDLPTYPHIGLGYLAAYLLSRGQQVQVIDAKLERLNLEETLTRLLASDPDMLGLTAFTPEIDHVARLAARVKAERPDVFTVIGGVHATALPRETLEEFPAFDALIFGEGEFACHELLTALERGEGLDGIPGLAFRREGQVVVNQPRPWITDLDALPFPAWGDLSNMTTYPIITARGCPFSCVFCMRPYGRQVRERSPENVVQEMELAMDRYGARAFYFWDETFGINKEKAHGLADMIIERGMAKQITWHMHTRVNVVDRPFLKKMKEAGCTSVAYGIESGNAEILKRVKKGITLEQAERAVPLAKEVGLRVNTYFILGHPHETWKTAWDTINFARKLNSTLVSIAIMIPFPKTEVAEMVAQGQGGYKQISYNWADYNKQTGSVVELESMGRRTLVMFQIAGYLLFYLGNLRFGTFFELFKARLGQISLLVRNLLPSKAKAKSGG